ncbi:quaternary ammonium compound-resistance protein SugE [Veronia nyctiphanis]|uniref:Guanidinium exporter n=1 Tax=Veronia nyctiphanis TaxID=1278244 RepID=A0A4Q0YLF3_9GAMM|nr:quaternary ammonium compound efflux SMR transporter SugE [Veronia nyctiphanis]RXJ71215.1 quaternary ammonium compound-resistance protein SugE [Veronia nyctiphanis]
MAWFCLAVAGLFEVFWAISMKYSQGFTKLWPSAMTIAGMWVSFGFLAYAMKTLPVGNAYAAWTGIGAVGVMIAGVILFDEKLDWVRMSCIGLIVIGIVGLKFMSGDTHQV